MYKRIRVIMTQYGMEKLNKTLTYGYMISCNAESVYVLEDEKKSIVRYARKFWKPYHAEEAY